MKTLNKILYTVTLLLSLTSCKKSNLTVTTTSGSINITNAVIGGATVTLDGLPYSQGSLSSNSFKTYPLFQGETKVDIYDAMNQSQIYYDQAINMPKGGNLSLFLTGLSPSQVNSVLIEETFKAPSDSTCAVRFINLSPDSSPISVDIQGNPDGSEVTSLSYKAFTVFKSYGAKSVNINNGYNFEIRDATTGSLITTYSFTPISFKNVTLCLTGLENSSNILLVNEN